LTYRRWLTVFFAFLLATVAVLAAGMGYAAHVIREPDFPLRQLDASIDVQERPFKLFHQHCDILIDGDSTASTGIDPRVITAQTGLNACNIASTRPIVDAFGTWPLDTFLAHNPPPRVLVLQFGPELFYRATSWDDIQPYAPYLLMLRQGTFAAALRLILRHPVQSVQVLQLFFKLQIPRSPAEQARLQGVYARTLAGFDESHGRLNLELAALHDCDAAPLELYGPLDSAWIRQLRQKYEARGILTLVNSSPIPACDPQLQKFQHDLAPFLDTDTTAMPVGLFVGGDRHMTAAGARIEAAVLARQIQAALASHPTTSH
jgi:hypothetical protein